MSPHRPDDDGRDERALCLQAALDPAGLAAELGSEAYSRFVTDPRHAAEIAAFAAFVSGVRRDLAVAPLVDPGALQRATRRVTRRVLARTTREERSWHGDLRLVVDFVSDRLRDSAALRFAAALLLVQVTVVPILAWHVLREREERPFTWRIERPEAPEESFLAEEPEETTEVQAPLDELPTGEALDLDARARLQRLGAAVCAAAGDALEALEAGGAAALAALPERERELARRALALRGGTRGVALDAVHRAPVAGTKSALTPEPKGKPDTEGVVALLRLERALDQRLFLGHAAGLGAALRALDSGAADPASVALTSRMRARAAALALVPEADAADVLALVPDAGYGRDLAEALGADAGGTWARAWRAALGAR